jgi:hypothetical protein
VVAHLEVDPLRRASEHIGNRLAAALGETGSATDAEIVLLTRARSVDLSGFALPSAAREVA